MPCLDCGKKCSCNNCDCHSCTSKKCACKKIKGWKTDNLTEAERIVGVFKNKDGILYEVCFKLKDIFFSSAHNRWIPNQKLISSLIEEIPEAAFKMDKIARLNSTTGKWTQQKNQDLQKRLSSSLAELKDQRKDNLVDDSSSSESEEDEHSSEEKTSTFNGKDEIEEADFRMDNRDDFSGYPDEEIVELYDKPFPVKVGDSQTLTKKKQPQFQEASLLVGLGILVDTSTMQQETSQDEKGTSEIENGTPENAQEISTDSDSATEAKMEEESSKSRKLMEDLRNQDDLEKPIIQKEIETSEEEILPQKKANILEHHNEGTFEVVEKEKEKENEDVSEPEEIRNKMETNVAKEPMKRPLQIPLSARRKKAKIAKEESSERPKKD